MKSFKYILLSLFTLSWILCEDIEIIVYSESFTIDTVDPEIEMYSPSHGDVFGLGEDIIVTWDASDNSPTPTPMSLNVSAYLDEPFMELFSGFPNTGNLVLDVPEFINTLFASVRLDIVDHYGNMSSAYSSGYFTLGDPNEEQYDVVDENITIQVNSDAFEVDTKAPLVAWIFPNESTSFYPLQGEVVRWEASDETFLSNPIDIEFVDGGVDTYALAENNQNTGIRFIHLPDIETSLGHFKVIATDAYGNEAYDLSDEYMTVGSDFSTEIVEESTVIEIDSDPFIMDTKVPTFNLIPGESDYFYPNGGEILTDYSTIALDWNCSDDSFDDGEVEVSLAYLLGGWYAILDTFPHSSVYASAVDLSLDGLVDNTIWARLIFTAIDDYGNRNSEYNDDYFVLGSSDGDIDIELTDEEDLEMMLSWTWNTSQHTVKILNRAINFLEEGDQIFIVDENGINNTDCEGIDGYIELASETCEINSYGNLKVSPIKSHIGINHCSAGGGKLTGYNEQDTVRFKIISGTDSYYLRPSAFRGSIVFDNSVTIIEEFNIEPYDLELQSNSDEITLWDDRDADNFNVYSKVTNHQSSFRNCDDDAVCDSSELLDYLTQEDCETNSGIWDTSYCYYDFNEDGIYSPDEVDENIGDCYSDCCASQGTGDNLDWCFVEEVSEEVYTHSLVQQNYVANEQSSATINYRVWVLDDNGNEMFKTVETDGVDINYDSNQIGTYELVLSPGWNWFSLNVHEGNGDMLINNIFSNSNPSNLDYFKGQTSASTYYASGGVWYPDEITLDVLSLYMVNMESEDILTYSGIYADDTDTLFIDSGWNWIGYVPQNPTDINTALASLSSNGDDYIKSQTSASTYYEAGGGQWYPPIVMNPTEGYMLNSANSDTLIYSEISRMSNEEDIFTDYIWDVNYKDYEYNASAILELDMEHLEVSENDQLAIFSNNTCIGVAKANICPLNDKILFPLMIYSNQEVENNLTLIYYNAISGNEISILETLDFEKDTYQGNAYDPIVLHDSTIPTTYNLANPYPNPFNPTTQIHFSLLDNVDNIELNIYDIRGRLVKSLISGYMVKGYHSIEWNASNFSSGIYFIHMNANNNTFIKKITLLK